MAFIKIWIHVVWATNNREHLLVKGIRRKVFDHIRENAKEKNIYLDFINGYTDHVHCLISLNADQTIAKVVQLLKGESAFWINKEKLTRTKFGWQDEYFAVSIGGSQTDAVRNYIRNQEVHHTKVSFQQEYDEFIEKYEFTKFSG